MEGRLKKILKSKIFLWAGMGVMLLSSFNASRAADIEGPALSITHNLCGYTNNGSTVTLDFTLNIINNSDTVFLDAEISDVLFGPQADRPVPEQFPVYIGNVPPSGNISVNCIIQSTFILPEDETKNFPILWEIRCMDETGHARFIVVESQPASSS